MATNTNPVTSPVVRLSYPTLFQPKAFRPGQDAKYSVTIMLDKRNQEHMAFLNKLVSDVQWCLDNHPWKGVKPRTDIVGNAKSPIKDGDTSLDGSNVPIREKNPEHAGHFIIRLSSTSKPSVVDGNMQPIIDSSKIYPGCWGRVSLNAYAYEGQESRGVTFGFGGVQFVKDDEPFGASRLPVDKMFTPDASAQAPTGYNIPGQMPPQYQQAPPQAQAPQYQPAPPQAQAPQYQQAPPQAQAPQYQPAPPQGRPGYNPDQGRTPGYEPDQGRIPGYEPQPNYERPPWEQ